MAAKKDSFSWRLGLAIAFAGLTVAACGESPAGPGEATFATQVANTTVDGGDLWTPPEYWYRRSWVCKVGSTATFEVSVDGGSPVEHTLLDGECKVVHFNDGGIDEVDVVTITELSSLNTELDSIVQDSTHGESIFRLATITGTTTATITTTRSKGGIAVFYNSASPPPPPPPSGGEGCTPGYWKQAHHFDSWTAPLTPNTLFADVFADAFPGKTLLDVVRLGGGDLNALGRHTVAALLNSASTGVDYDVATAGVISGFNTAFASGQYEGQKNIFEGFNEQGCPLN